MAKDEKGLVWLRRDLRLRDNRALAAATQSAARVYCVFVFDTCILEKLVDPDDRRLTFIYECLQDLATQLGQLGSALIVKIGDPIQVIPDLARELSVSAVYFNEDYAPYAKKRDGQVRELLEKQNMAALSFKDHVIFAGSEIQTQKATPFKVFTPYKQSWLKAFSPGLCQEATADLSKLAPAPPTINGELPPLAEVGFQLRTDNILRGGEQAAQTRLKEFCQGRIAGYDQGRDFPYLDGTSYLSPYLRFGCLSSRQVVAQAYAAQKASKNWLNELIWREFYQMILDQFPHSAWHSFKPQYEHLAWPGKPDHLGAWQEGRTGYPLVDAAMRGLRATGWMHNRLRMVVASFLCKDLLLDWRQGARHFARYLLDYDLAANSGGWQWSASTGCDAQPYFRIFNPVQQSLRFDADGTFIRTWCPELKKLDNKNIHAPWLASPQILQHAQIALGRDYPWPIVEHRQQATQAIALFKGLSA